MHLTVDVKVGHQSGIDAVLTVHPVGLKESYNHTINHMLNFGKVLC